MTALRPSTVRGDHLAITGLLLNLSAVAILLVLHYYLNQPHVVFHASLMPLLAVPLTFFAGIYGLRSVAITALAALGFLSDDLRHSHALVLILEFGQLALIAVAATFLGIVVRAESKADAKLRENIAARIANLKGRPNYWQQVALTRTGVYVTRIEEQFLSAALSGMVRGDSAVLDVGSGSGRLEHVLLKSAGRVIATEVNLGDLELMPEHRRITCVHVGDHPSLPLRSESMNAVVAIEVPAVSDQEWFKEECRRVLRPGGHVVLTVHNARSYKGFWHSIRAKRREARGQPWARLYYQQSVQSQERAWQGAGFRVVARHGFNWAPLSRQSDSRWVGIVSVLERLLGLRGVWQLSPWVLLHLQRAEA